ncbi:MAG: endo alpha-1,4 polygalactosaminidase [Vicinamibacterales bacterium]
MKKIVQRAAHRSSGVLMAAALLSISMSPSTEVRAASLEQQPSVWRPAPGTSWQWQLTGMLDLSFDVAMYDLDLFETSSAVVATVHARGAKAVCYISAGTWEDWRPDAQRFSSVVKGRANGWAGEVWLDIRSPELRPIMEARMDLCKSKGFDGIEPDNVDGYSNTTGFPLTSADQLTYNRFLADAAHTRGLSVGLKNDVEQTADLVDWFDWALNEECFKYGECEQMSSFINAGKAVFHVEYGVASATFCKATKALGFSSLKKRRRLDAYRIAC